MDYVPGYIGLKITNVPSELMVYIINFYQSQPYIGFL